MVLLNTTSFSGVASQAIPTVFNATYDFYQIILDITNASADQTTYLKLRSGVTDSSASYFWGYPGITQAGSGSNENGNNSSTGWWVVTTDAGNNNHYSTAILNLYRPFLAVPTTMTYNSTSLDFSGVVRGNAGGGVHGVLTSYDSFNILPSSGTISGKIQVYGFNQ
jgi:hypothetical protein